MEKTRFDIPFEVITIEAKPQKATEEDQESKMRLRVCAYARVSTEREEQEYSFDRQVEYYKKYIQERADWQFVGMYADLGLSGKNKKRPQFMEMLEKCRNGQIDRIITKSISRFARNTIDCLQTVRELKDKGIGVYFEKEALDSLAPGVDLVLSIMAVFAEEESRSISKNIKWAIQKRFAKGQATIVTKRFLGYTRGDSHDIVIVPIEALVVRKIYELYIGGMSLYQICEALENEKILTSSGNIKWQISTILVILQNEKYTGDCLLQKTYSPDFLSTKRYRNNGQVKSYYIKKHHAPIVQEQLFNQVQEEIKRRREIQKAVVRSKYSNKYPLSGKMICGECGAVMRRHAQHRVDGKHGYWVCTMHERSKKCSICQVKEVALMDGFQCVLKQILYGKEEKYAESIKRISAQIEDTDAKFIADVDKKITLANQKANDIRVRHEAGCIEDKKYYEEMREIMFAEPYLMLKREEITADYLQLQSAEERKAKVTKLADVQNLYDKFNENLFTHIVDAVIIKSEKFAVYRLINGSEYYAFLDTWRRTGSHNHK